MPDNNRVTIQPAEALPFVFTFAIQTNHEPMIKNTIENILTIIKHGGMEALFPTDQINGMVREDVIICAPGGEQRNYKITYKKNGASEDKHA